MSNIKSPYDYKRIFDNDRGLKYVQEFNEIPGHIQNPYELMTDNNLYILDLAPTILRDFANDPRLLLPAVASPTFGVSLFDVAPRTVGSNQKWFSIIEKLHYKIKKCIEEESTLKDTVVNLVERAYTHYRDCLDHIYTSELYTPCNYFLAVALMDVYHICNNIINHDVEYLNFTPTFILTSDAPLKYVQNYSALFSMNPPVNEGKMSRQMFEQMAVDLDNYSEIKEFLEDRHMEEVLKSRNDSLNVYNAEVFEILKNYVFTCLKCIQSSPLIKNKHECMETLLKINHCVDRKHAAMCFFYFKDCIDSLIHSNLLDGEKPFTFRHDLGEDGIFYCPIPPLMS